MQPINYNLTDDIFIPEVRVHPIPEQLPPENTIENSIIKNAKKKGKKLPKSI